MKKIVKLCLIAGGTCVLIGGGIAAVAVAMGGTLWEAIPYEGREWTQEFPDEFREEFWQSFDHSWEEEEAYYDHHMESMNRETGNSQEYSIADVKDLSINVRNGHLVVVEDKETDKITVTSNRSEVNWECYVDEDELNLEVNTEQSWSNDSLGLILTVGIPENYHFRKVELNSKSRRNNGAKGESPYIEVTKITAEELELEAKAGAIRVMDGRIGRLDAACDVGAVEFTGSVSGNIDTDCKVGALKLQLNDSEESYNYDIQCRLGAVKVGNREYAGLKSKKNIDNNAAKNMDLECSTGAVEISFANQV